jgi:hypothetical protein
MKTRKYVPMVLNVSPYYVAMVSGGSEVPLVLEDEKEGTEGIIVAGPDPAVLRQTVCEIGCPSAHIAVFASVADAVEKLRHYAPRPFNLHPCLEGPRYYITRSTDEPHFWPPRNGPPG